MNGIMLHQNLSVRNNYVSVETKPVGFLFKNLSYHLQILHTFVTI